MWATVPTVGRPGRGSGPSPSRRLEPLGATGTEVPCSAYPQSPAGPKEDTPMIRPSRSARKSRFLLPFLVFSVLALALLGATSALAGGRPFTTTLAGPSEVPAGDPDATGTATVWVNPGTGTVCYTWSVNNAATPIFAAHIHHGIAGVAGPVVVPLPPTSPSSGTGCTTGISRSLALDIIEHP